MTKYILTVGTVFVLLIAVAGAKEASAQGFHFGGHGIHVDVGYPHGSYGCYPSTSYWGGGWGGWGSHTWHDTTHLDYHPGGFVPHYNHGHYAPAHYDIHSSGHWGHHF